MGYVVGYDGVKFPATQVPSSDANTLDDYEENTWTPTDASGAGLTFSSVSGRYIKIGRVVHVWCVLAYPATANGTAAKIGGLPFTVNNSEGSRGGHVTYTDESTLRYALTIHNTTTVSLFDASGAAITNATMSTNTIVFSAVYEASA